MSEGKGKVVLMLIYSVEGWDNEAEDGFIFHIDSIGDIDAVEEVAVELKRRGITEYEAECYCVYGDGSNFWMECTQGQESYGYYEY